MLYFEGITLVIPNEHRMFLLSRAEAKRLLIMKTGFAIYFFTKVSYVNLAPSWKPDMKLSELPMLENSL